LAVGCAAFLSELKRLLRDGLLLLEGAHSDSPAANADAAICLRPDVELTAIAEQIPGVLICWLEQVASTAAIIDDSTS